MLIKKFTLLIAFFLCHSLGFARVIPVIDMNERTVQLNVSTESRLAAAMVIKNFSANTKYAIFFGSIEIDGVPCKVELHSSSAVVLESDANMFYFKTGNQGETEIQIRYMNLQYTNDAGMSSAAAAYDSDEYENKEISLTIIPDEKDRNNSSNNKLCKFLTDAEKWTEKAGSDIEDWTKTAASDVEDWAKEAGSDIKKFFKRF